MFEVFQPVIELPKNVVQPLKKIYPVVSHPDPAEVLLDRDPHIIGIVE